MLPTSRFAAREAPHKQNCCSGGFPQVELLLGRLFRKILKRGTPFGRLPTSRFAAQDAPHKQICCPGGSPQAELLLGRLPTRRSKPEAKRDAIRTVSFLLKTRGPDLVAWSAEHDWQLNRDGLAPFICDFTGRAGDGQSTETKWANVAQLSPFTSSLQAATLDEDTLVQALLQGTRKKVATAMQELSGFGGKGTGFVLEHLLEGLAFVDEATGVFPWTKTSAPAAIGPNTEKLFQAFCPDKLPSDVMAAVLPLVKQMLPSKLFVDGKDIGVRLLVKDHVLQQNCCKLYQVLQFVFSGCVGTHGRIKATSNADEDSDDDDV